MAQWQTNTQADAYYGTNASAPAGWSDLNTTEKTQFLDMASERLNTFDWPAALDTEAKRVADKDVEAMFYELVRHYVERKGRPTQSVVEASGDAISPISDLPLTVASRLLTYIPTLEQVSAGGARSLTAEERAKLTAEAAKLNAETAALPSSAEKTARLTSEKAKIDSEKAKLDAEATAIITSAERTAEQTAKVSQLTADTAKLNAEAAKLTAETAALPTAADVAAKKERSKIRPIFF